MRRKPDFWKEFKQHDLFPNRETVGTEYEAVMIARFTGSVIGVGQTAISRTAARATEERAKIPTPGPSLTWMDDKPQKVLRRNDVRRRNR